MRIHSEHPDLYLQALASAVGKDPVSLEQWRCLHVQHGGDISFDRCESALWALKDSHPNLECDAVHCADNDVLLISRDVPADRLHTLALELAVEESAGGRTDINTELYDLLGDWRTVKSLLNKKTRLKGPPIPRPANHHFGEIASLGEVFEEAKHLRQSRMPLHIMLVEDDPITRHLVAGSFKDNYALITAIDAQEAVANYLLHAPDIVFLDIGLPDASGLEALRQIMACDPDAYVVMLSANHYLDNVTDALVAGASGFVAKPFRKERLRHYIQDSARHHRKHLG